MAKANQRDQPNGASERLLAELEGTSDRAAVIVCTALIEAELRMAIENHMGRMDERGLLDSFKARIMIAHKLGFIDESLAKALRLIGEIRNSMAHQVLCELNDPKIKDKIKKLTEPLIGPTSEYASRDELLKVRDDPRKTLDHVLIFFVVIIGDVASRIERFKSLEQASVTGISLYKGKPPKTGFA